MTRRGHIVELLLLFAALCAPLAAQDSGAYSGMGTCSAGNPRMYFVVDAVVTGSCAAGGGTGESQCCCLGGSWANCATGGSGAPTTADYLVKTADGGLSAERVVTDTGTITWDWATGGQAKATAVDLTCTNCIGSTEIDESTLGIPASGAYLPASSAPAIDAAGGVWGESGVLAYEGNVADASETRIIVEEPTADRYFQVPNLTGYAQLSDCATCYGTAANSVMTTTNGVLFEGTTAIAFETTLLAGDPTADRTITLPDNTGTVVTTGSGYAMLKSWSNPPSSPHSYDDEFDSGTLAAKWTRSSSGTTNPVATGTIDYTASLTTPITDATSVPSVLMFQSDNSSLGTITILQNYTPATNETHFFKILCNGRNVSTNGEGSFYFFLSNSTDNNEFVGFGTSNSGSLHDNWAYVTNNGTQTGTASGSFNEGVRLPAAYLAVWKKGNDYYFGIAGEDKGMWNVYTSKTKTGVTTFDRVGFFFQTANETPSIVEGLDFYRYKASLDYSLVNP